MVSQEDRIFVKFANFSLAKIGNEMKTFCGSLQYAAPEVLRKGLDLKRYGPDRYNIIVDIWALGLVIAKK